MSPKITFITLSTITCLLIQFGSMVFLASFLLWFQMEAQKLSAIIGVLSLIIIIAIANLIAHTIYRYVVSDKNKRELGQKGNNLATIFLVTLIPFILFNYLDYIETNLTETIYYTSGMLFLLVGIVMTFFLQILKLKS